MLKHKRQFFCLGGIPRRNTSHTKGCPAVELCSVRLHCAERKLEKPESYFRYPRLCVIIEGKANNTRNRQSSSHRVSSKRTVVGRKLAWEMLKMTSKVKKQALSDAFCAPKAGQRLCSGKNSRSNEIRALGFLSACNRPVLDSSSGWNTGLGLVSKWVTCLCFYPYWVQLFHLYYFSFHMKLLL